MIDAIIAWITAHPYLSILFVFLAYKLWEQQQPMKEFEGHKYVVPTLFPSGLAPPCPWRVLCSDAVPFILILSIYFPHRVQSVKNLQEFTAALAKAKEAKQLTICDFYAKWCPPVNGCTLR